MVDVIGNMATVRTFVATARECLRIGSFLEQEMASREASLRHLEKLRLLHAVITVVLSCCLLGWVLWLWSQERATTGDVVLVSSLGFAILHGTRDLAVALVGMIQHLARLAEAAQSLLVPREMEETVGVPTLQIRDANIDFENVTFSYPGAAACWIISAFTSMQVSVSVWSDRRVRAKPLSSHYCNAHSIHRLAWEPCAFRASV